MLKSQILFIMGVSGCGKSTVGKLLAEKLKIAFFDGDDFHPEANIKKLSSGKPLNDNDRQGWLERLNELALENVEKSAVIVCSALKQKYRAVLGKHLEGHHQVIYLKGSFEQISHHLEHRKNHFMPKGLLQSQFDTLEEPEKAITVSIAQKPEEIVHEIMIKLQN